MSNTNYTKFSNNKPEKKPVEIQNGVAETEEVVVEQKTEEVKEPTYGIVYNCKKLNVRVAPYVDADIECTIDEDSKVIINEAESTEDFYKVCTAAGVEGFCMKDYIFQFN